MSECNLTVRIELLIKSIHRQNPKFGLIKSIDFDKKEVTSMPYFAGRPTDEHKYEIKNDVLIYRGLMFTI